MMEREPGKPLRIIILEDEPDDAELVERKLRKAGLAFTALRAENRAQFLAAIEGPGADLLLADFNLPDITGLDALHIIRERGLDLPTILVTGSQGEEIAVACIREGASDYILKDRMERLPAAVEGILAQRKAEREKREALVALEMSEGRYRDLANNLPEIIFEADPMGRITYVNRSAFVLTGFTPADLDRGVNLLEMVAPDDRDRARDLMRRLLAGEEIGIQEYYLLRADGTVYAAMIHSMPIMCDGAATGFRGIVVDITERKQAEEALRESETRFRSLIEAAPDSVFVQSEGRFVFLNPSALELFGASAEEEMLGSDLMERMAPEYHEAVLDRIRAQRETGQPSPLMVQEYLRLDGSRVPVETTAVPIHYKGREAHLVFVRNITERKRAEEALETSEKLFREFFEKNPAATYMSSASGEILSCNEAFLVLFGFRERGEALNFPVEKLYEDPSGRDKFHESLHDRHSVSLRECRFRSPSGKIVVALETASGIYDAGGRLTGVIGFLLDLTTNRDLQAQFLHSQKMEAVGRLAGGIAHDFNNILTTILTFAELSSEALPSASSVKPHLDQIRVAAERAAKLTRQLLAYSRQQVILTKDLNLGPLIDSVLKMVGRVLGESIQVEVVKEEGVPPIHGDAGQMEQVLMNLIINARDAMENGGKLSIELCRATGEEGDGTPPGVLLRVSDTGVGMSPEVVSQAFDPYFTTKSVEKGTGLGLSVVEGIVRQHGGTLRVESELGKGTSFTVLLPPVERARTHSAMEDERLTSLDGREFILLVEDEPGVRDATREALTSLGYRVLCATDPANAMDLFETVKDKVDLVLSDMMMPGGVTGRTLCEGLKRRKPGLRTLLMSGHTEDLLLKEGVSSGEVHFIAKPFSRLSLASKIREVLDE